MSNVIIRTAAFTIPNEPPTLPERLMQLLYLFVLSLALFTLWTMAETRSMEARTTRYVPPATLPLIVAQLQSAD